MSPRVPLHWGPRPINAGRLRHLSKDPEVINRKVYWCFEHRYIRRTVLNLCQSCKFTRLFGSLFDPETSHGYGLAHELSLPGPFTGFIPISEGMRKCIDRLSTSSGERVSDFVRSHFTRDLWLHRDIIGSPMQPWLTFDTARAAPSTLLALSGCELSVENGGDVRIKSDYTMINAMLLLVWFCLLGIGTVSPHQLSNIVSYPSVLAFTRLGDSSVSFHDIRPLLAESRPLTKCQVDKLESEYVGFEAEEPRPPQCPLMAHHLSNRVVKAIVDHDMTLLNERSIDSSGRPVHLRQKWKLTRNRRRLDPVLFRIGEKVKGRVAVTFPTYALVDIGSTSYGVLHARDMSEGWIDRVDHSVSSGDDIVVIVKSIDDDGRFIRLSLLDLPKLESATGEPITRRPLHSFRVEEVVSGVIRRRSPLGYYIDIGATVDGFLHVNDRKLSRKYTGVRRQPFRIGTMVPALYIKSVDLVKNRIQLSENSLVEDMEKRCITGQETPEQQATYSPVPHESFVDRLKSHDFDRMRMIGGYDDLLDYLGCDRNASTAYVKYLENRKRREELERYRATLFDDADNMSDWQLRQATNKYNEIAMEIAQLNNEAIEPPPMERTVYKYGSPGVWESRVYTRFDESNPSAYFRKLTGEVQSALRDVQGESYNFKGAMPDDLCSPERRGEIIESLWERFHSAPSSLSQNKDSEPRYSTIEDVEDIVPASLVSTEAEPVTTSYADSVISELESYNDSDASELAAMIRGASDFNPFDHSPKLVDDDQSALLGACAMTNDDVSQWTTRLDRLYADGAATPSDLATLARGALGEPQDADLDPADSLVSSAAGDAIPALPNVDEYVDSTPGASSDNNFSSPTFDDEDEQFLLDTESDTGHSSDSESSEPLNFDEEGLMSESGYSDDCDTDSYDSGSDDSDVEDFKDIAENIFPKCGSSAAASSLSDVSPSEDPSGYPSSPKPSQVVPKGPLEPVYNYYNPPTMDDYVRDIFSEVRAITGDVSDPGSSTATETVPKPLESRDTRRINRHLRRSRQRHLDPITRLYLMTKFPPRQVPWSAKSSVDDPGSSESSEDSEELVDSDEYEGSSDVPVDFMPSDFSDDDFEFGTPEDLKKIRSILKGIVKSGNSRRALSRLARKVLPAELVSKYQCATGEDEHMEEMATLLRDGKPRPKVTPYTYYPEGIDAAGVGEDRRSMNRRIRDAHVKLSKLKRNKRFLHMLDRLGVDVSKLTFDNIHEVLPLELVSSRPPPFRRLMGIGQSIVPGTRG
ncbi:Heme ligase [Babesia sp. Xinjiang]|uniref:Heme ligase n=1 Tax=Babesia sp. Xinjiang TaxID=462227 RepID=UPI000A22088F|nr:Heme ligase [Babesia sp. Xinjiang]ORM40039.1 Heme ligase [Babesia sp. Xinjiang]